MRQLSVVTESCSTRRLNGCPRVARYYGFKQNLLLLLLDDMKTVEFLVSYELALPTPNTSSDHCKHVASILWLVKKCQSCFESSAWTAVTIEGFASFSSHSDFSR